MIRVLIVDDSRTARLVLTRVLENQADFTVVGAAADAFEARRLILTRRPDVVTLDLQMPRMSGLDFLAKLMEHHPLPVVVVSSMAAEKGKAALDALRLGAVEVVGKARLGSDPAAAVPLVYAIRAAGQAKLRRSHAQPPRAAAELLADAPSVVDRALHRDLIAIGASTGGTRAIEDLLRRLPGNTPGLVIAQHLPAAFTRSFAARLNAVSDLSVREAQHGEIVCPGIALIAPGGRNIGIVRVGRQLRVQITDRSEAGGQSPCIDVLFHSVAAACGPAAVGILLTGMGSDGAQGLAAMRNARAFTIAEHESSCVVYGMPRAAIALGAAAAATPLHDIAPLLLHVLDQPVTAQI